MARYILRRLIQAIPTLFGITILSFGLMSLAPGGPVSALLPPQPGVTQADREALAARLGVNDPWIVQYLRWLTGDDWMRVDTDGDGLADRAFLVPLDADGDGEAEPPGENRGILRGDFGTSFTQRGTDAMAVIFQRVPATLELGVLALSLGLVIGIPVGILSAVYQGGVFDNVSRVAAVIFDAIPNFWFGLILILTLGIQFDLLEFSGRADPVDLMFTDSYPPLWERWEYIVLPVIVLAVGVIAGYSRFSRASMLDVINQDYIRTAKAKGIANRRIWFLHGARNAMIPIATFLGPALLSLLGGAAVTESVFSWPGVGLQVLDAVQQRDYPVVMAATLIAAISTILGYLLSDILYAILDPRIRYD